MFDDSSHVLDAERCDDASLCIFVVAVVAAVVERKVLEGDKNIVFDVASIEETKDKSVAWK